MLRPVECGFSFSQPMTLLVVTKSGRLTNYVASPGDQVFGANNVAPSLMWRPAQRLGFGTVSPSQPSQLQDLLSAVQVKATLYNMFLNSTNTEVLATPRHPLPQTRFANGDSVPVAEEVKYLGAKVTWKSPTKAAIKDRQQKGHLAYCKIQHMWRSRLCWKAKVRLSHSYIVPVLLYSLSTLTLEEKHFTSIDGWYFEYLRRCMRIKASYYTHIPNQTVWIKAGRPTPFADLPHPTNRQTSRYYSKTPYGPHSPRYLQSKL